MPAVITSWVSGIALTGVPPNTTKMTVNLTDALNVPPNTGWFLTVWYQNSANMNWYPMMGAGDSAMLVTKNNTVTFTIPSGLPPATTSYAIQVGGVSFPGGGAGPGMLSAFFTNSMPHGTTEITLVGLNFPSVPPPGWGITQNNPDTSISVSVVLSGGGGM